MRKHLIACFALALLGAASAQNITITVAGYSNDTPIVQKLIQKFVHIPGVTVKWEPITGDFSQFITNALAAGTAPDIFYLDVYVAKALVQSGKILPLNSFFARDHFDPSAFIPELVQAFTFGGKLYAVPKDFNALVTFYNKDMFKAAGVPYPNAHDTWATFTEKIAKVNAYLKAHGSQAYGMSVSADPARFIPFALAAGGHLFAPDGSANSITAKPWIEAMNFYVGFQKHGWSVMPSQLSQGWAGAAFANNLAAAVWEGDWEAGFIADNNPTLNYGVAPLPLAPNGKRANFLFTVGYAIAKNSEHPNTAFKVIEALTSLPAEEYVLEHGLAIPSRKALANDPYFKEKTPEAEAAYAVFEATKGAVPYRFGDVGGKYVDALQQALTQVLTGAESPEQALAQAAAQINSALGK